MITIPPRKCRACNFSRGEWPRDCDEHSSINGCEKICYYCAECSTRASYNENNVYTDGVVYFEDGARVTEFSDKIVVNPMDLLRERDRFQQEAEHLKEKAMEADRNRVMRDQAEFFALEAKRRERDARAELEQLKNQLKEMLKKERNLPSGKKPKPEQEDEPFIVTERKVEV